MKRWLAALLFSFSAQATTFSTDLSDLWYNQSEDGWGVNVIQQGEILFVTLFVYGANGQPTWYVGSDLRHNGSGQLVFTGPFYQTNGPFHGGAFNPAAVGVRQVGTATFTLTSVTTGTFQYTTDGTAVTKQVIRQTWRVNNLSNNYMGGANGTYTGCTGLTGYQEEIGLFAISQTASTITVTASSAGGSCTYTGQYNQRGRMGTAAGNFTCTSGFAGQFQIIELEASISHFAGRIQLLAGSCSYNGRVGGLTRGAL